ncbi:hypothetical protein K439DRAFT_1633483 [Ramaria rubella]|nr:hypothetical protein K439DRAFT_1633483 [Ramaria rubella]
MPPEAWGAVWDIVERIPKVTNTSSFRSYEFQRRIVIFNHLELLESRGCPTTPVFAVDIPVYSLPPSGINIFRISNSARVDAKMLSTEDKLGAYLVVDALQSVQAFWTAGCDPS